MNLTNDLSFEQEHGQDLKLLQFKLLESNLYKGLFEAALVLVIQDFTKADPDSPEGINLIHRMKCDYLNKALYNTRPKEDLLNYNMDYTNPDQMWYNNNNLDNHKEGT